MGKKIDLTGQTFGRWTVIEEAGKTSGRHVKWLCECSCENKTRREITGNSLRSGSSKSCGCLRNELASEKNKVDLTGQAFGKWTVLEEGGRTPNGGVRWICECSCENKTRREITGSTLRSGGSQSCGCKFDLTGKTFGELTVIEKDLTRVSSGGNIYWWCQCSCGAIKSVCSGELKCGKTQSCGHVKSRGEEKISKILSENNIKFRKEQIFNDLKSKKDAFLRYDFSVLDSNNNIIFLIEFDGIQHFEEYYGSWSESNPLIERQYYDQIKNKYALDNNILLYRIPYTEYKNLVTIEDLFNEKFLIS